MRSIFFFLLVLNLGFAAWHLALGDRSSSGIAALEQQLAMAHVDAPKLKLVSDLKPGSQAMNLVDDQEYSADELCWTLGPFDAGETASAVQTRLRATGVDMGIQKKATPVAPDYWVHVVPQENRQAVVELLRDLQRRNIDSFIITEGELENGISLGFYSDESSAREVVAEHAGQAYEVDVKLVSRDIEEYWGLVRRDEFDKLSERAWERFRVENGDLALQQNNCNAVASAGNLE